VTEKRRTRGGEKRRLKGSERKEGASVMPGAKEKNLRGVTPPPGKEKKGKEDKE